VKLTNKFNLPEVFMKAVINDKYSIGEAADFSVTGLLKPARQSQLEYLNRDQIEDDVSNRIFSLLGQSIHTILERGAGETDVVEKRFFADFDGKIVSGQIDLLSAKGALVDFKVTQVYPFTDKGGRGNKPEWVAQLNMQLELLRRNGLDAKSLHICGILKDWSASGLDPSNKMKYTKGYPLAPVVVVSIPMWSREQTQEFIRNRIKAHLSAMEKLSLCSKEETWSGRRCKGYCVVSDFCDQYKETKQTGIMKETYEV